MCLALLLGGIARAEEPEKVGREVWLCGGVVQSAPGEALQPQERRLEFDFISGEVLMTVGGTLQRTRFRASRMHFEAAFPVTLEGGLPAVENVNLARSNGRITATVHDAEGRRLRLFRSSCRPEGAPE
jgi:hypothetical protein